MGDFEHCVRKIREELSKFSKSLELHLPMQSQDQDASVSVISESY